MTRATAPPARPVRPELMAAPRTVMINARFRPNRSRIAPTNRDTTNTPTVTQVLIPAAKAADQPKSSAITGNSVPNKV
jgi:hypothetical protein